MKSKSANASANASAKPTFDPLVVPDGDAKVLLKFIGKVQNLRAPRKQSPADAQAFVAKKCEAVIAAADKILAADPAANIRVSAALQSKLQALAALDDTGDDKAGTSLAALVDQIKDDKQPGISKLTKRYTAQAAEVTASATTAKMEIKARISTARHLTRRPSNAKSRWSSCGPPREAFAGRKCPTSPASMPNRNRGFEVVSISMDTDKSVVQKYLQENPSMSWQVLFGGSGMAVSYPGQKSGEFSIPKMMLVNKRGVVLSDTVSDAELTSKLAELLGP